jgi:hypothetical protein
MTVVEIFSMYLTLFNTGQRAGDHLTEVFSRGNTLLGREKRQTDLNYLQIIKIPLFYNP